MRITDAHAHLNEPTLDRYLDWANPEIGVVSNSVDVESSERNLELSKRYSWIIPFVGIHPEIFMRDAPLTNQDLDAMVNRVFELSRYSKGIGEIGLDPKYGRIKDQEHLFQKVLTSSEKLRIPLTIHSRDTVSRILEFLSTFDFKSKLLFHWFSGNESELRLLHDRGIYTSFGPPILFSARLAKLLRSSRIDLVLAETDSPTEYRSISKTCGNPSLVTSVIFKMSDIIGRSFQDTINIISNNTCSYLATQG